MQETGPDLHDQGPSTSSPTECSELITRVAGMDMMRWLVLFHGSPVVGTILGVPAFQLTTLAATWAHPALLKLFMVLYLQEERWN